MSASGLLRVLVRELDEARIPFMLTGSMAAAVHGAGRATLDIDLVIEVSEAQLTSFVASLSSPELYVSAEAAAEALAHETMFNVVDVESGWKADLIVRKDRPFSKSEFARRQSVDFEGLQLWVVSLEDLMIAKLERARLGGSARQLEDVAALLRAAVRELDVAYLEDWVGRLGLQSQWESAQQLSSE